MITINVSWDRMSQNTVRKARLKVFRASTLKRVGALRAHGSSKLLLAPTVHGLDNPR
jgi:hypothetical protein